MSTYNFIMVGDVGVTSSMPSITDSNHGSVSPEGSISMKTPTTRSAEPSALLCTKSHPTGRAQSWMCSELDVPKAGCAQ
ncbi:unnamed protein product [Phytophthora fragariaefolia]|uniref:Unnamed protein product n=1 Tax=Phytophthora fragariaefolia TaxID=1490495 RepID=A0A9W6Y2E2_9STRA|nr:unnamed protein product [Phytophthora fragariaefolia]